MATNRLFKLIWSPQGLAALLMFAIMLWYVTLPIDLVPDGIAIFGYIDDAVAIFIVLYAAFSVLAPDIYKEVRKILVK